MSPHPDDIAGARTELLRALRARDYAFITPTPLTHARVIARKQSAKDLRDVFGWSLPFRETLDAEIVALMQEGDVLERRGELLASQVRVSSLDDDLFLHSSYPTTQHDAVFFGPDSYRFAAFIKAELPRFGQIKHLVDFGAGSGVGGIAALRAAKIRHLTLTDVNARANEYAEANLDFVMQTRAKGDTFSLSNNQADGLDWITDPIDVVIANPPYIVDASHRAYRDGGDMHGAAISLDWAKQAAARLKRGGALLLYTGSAIIDGEDRFKAALHEALCGFDFSYRELDPDVFGEELEREDYADVERIAVVGIVAVKR